MTKRWCVLGALVLTGACHDGIPTGQVLARVDGREITETELAAEARAAPAPPNAQLRRLVDRVLLAETARRQGADLSPIYRADLRRTRDLLLAEALRRQVAAGIAAPIEATALAYAAAHPWTFARRALVTLVASDGTAAEADTAALDPATAVIVGAAPVGRELHLGGRRLHVVARRDLPVAPGSTLVAARAALVAQETDRRMLALLGTARASAMIVYRPGLGLAQQ